MQFTYIWLQAIPLKLTSSLNYVICLSLCGLRSMSENTMCLPLHMHSLHHVTRSLIVSVMHLEFAPHCFPLCSEFMFSNWQLFNCNLQFCKCTSIFYSSISVVSQASHLKCVLTKSQQACSNGREFAFYKSACVFKTVGWNCKVEKAKRRHGLNPRWISRSRVC